MTLPRLWVAPIDFPVVRDAVLAWHRHHTPSLGHMASFGVYLGSRLVGVLSLGRPVSPHLQAQGWLEVTRVATDGTYNACSKLYARAVAWVRAHNRALSRAGGEPYLGLVTYILGTETGASLRAAGWVEDELRADSSARRGRTWSRYAGHEGGGVRGARRRYSLLLR